MDNNPEFFPPRSGEILLDRMRNSVKGDVVLPLGGGGSMDVSSRSSAGAPPTSPGMVGTMEVRRRLSASLIVVTLLMT